MAETIATITGTIQKYFEKSWMDLPKEEFRTPMANSDLLTKAVIPKNSGTYAEFRMFADMTVETNGTDDSPKTYSENAEPSTAVAASASVFQVAFEMLADYFELGAIQAATDPIDLLKKKKEQFHTLIRRKMHMLTNDRCVKPITANVLNSSQSPTPLPAPFKTIMTGGKSAFGSLTANDVFTMADFKTARSLLDNIGAPKAFGSGESGLYAAIISNAVKDQLLEDAVFRDIVKRSEDRAGKAFGVGMVIDWEGMRWIVQDDGYRCNLPSAGGALTTRKNTGAVHVAHVLGKDAMGYVDFGGSADVQRKTLMPKFKVQDLSVTGTGFTVGYRMPYQACVLNRRRGVNIAGTSNFNATIDDLA